MMDLSLAQEYFASTIYCERGFYTTGQLGPQPGNIGENFFLLPRRILKTKPNTPLRGGDVIRDHGVSYIVEEHAQSEVFDRVIFKKFRLYQVTERAVFTTETVTKDPILGKEIRSGVPVSHGPYPFVIETVRLESDGGMQNIQTVVRIISAVAVPIGAVVEGLFRVTASDQQGGVYFLTASRL